MFKKIVVFAALILLTGIVIMFALYQTYKVDPKLSLLKEKIIGSDTSMKLMFDLKKYRLIDKIGMGNSDESHFKYSPDFGMLDILYRTDFNLKKDADYCVICAESYTMDLMNGIPYFDGNIGVLGHFDWLMISRQLKDIYDVNTLEKKEGSETLEIYGRNESDCSLWGPYYVYLSQKEIAVAYGEENENLFKNFDKKSDKNQSFELNSRQVFHLEYTADDLAEDSDDSKPSRVELTGDINLFNKSMDITLSLEMPENVEPYYSKIKEAKTKIDQQDEKTVESLPLVSKISKDISVSKNNNHLLFKIPFDKRTSKTIKYMGEEVQSLLYFKFEIDEIIEVHEERKEWSKNRERNSDIEEELAGDYALFSPLESYQLEDFGAFNDSSCVNDRVQLKAQDAFMALGLVSVEEREVVEGRKNVVLGVKYEFNVRNKFSLGTSGNLISKNARIKFVDVLNKDGDSLLSDRQCGIFRADQDIDIDRESSIVQVALKSGAHHNDVDKIKIAITFRYPQKLEKHIFSEKDLGKKIMVGQSTFTLDELKPGEAEFTIHGSNMPLAKGYALNKDNSQLKSYANLSPSTRSSSSFTMWVKGRPESIVLYFGKDWQQREIVYDLTGKPFFWSQRINKEIRMPESFSQEDYASMFSKQTNHETQWLNVPPPNFPIRHVDMQSAMGMNFYMTETAFGQSYIAPEFEVRAHHVPEIINLPFCVEFKIEKYILNDGREIFYPSTEMLQEEREQSANLILKSKWSANLFFKEGGYKEETQMVAKAKFMSGYRKIRPDLLKEIHTKLIMRFPKKIEKLELSDFHQGSRHKTELIDFVIEKISQGNIYLHFNSGTKNLAGIKAYIDSGEQIVVDSMNLHDDMLVFAPQGQIVRFNIFYVSEFQDEAVVPMKFSAAK